jgi:hypothetical protein
VVGGALLAFDVQEVPISSRFFDFLKSNGAVQVFKMCPNDGHFFQKYRQRSNPNRAFAAGLLTGREELGSMPA